MIQDIGKFCGNCLYIMGGIALFSMLFAWWFQHALYMEFSWIFFLWIGFLLRSHNNKARQFTIGFSVLGLAIGVVLLVYGIVNPEFFQSMHQLEDLTVFAVKIRHPSAITVSIFIILAYSINLTLLILLLSKRAKTEFSDRTHEAELDPPVE